MLVRRSSAQIPLWTALQAQYSRIALLYLTLVRDGADPSGFQQEFETLASAIETGADRALRQSAKGAEEERDRTS